MHNSTDQSPLSHLEQRLTEAYDSLWSDVIDPAEPYYDEYDGAAWLPVGAVPGADASSPWPLTDQRLWEIRRQCRQLALTNEFAINGHENRVSYIVGPGHTYRAVIKKGHNASADTPLAVQEVLDEFERLNQWHRRQQEIVRRRDRDGEVFLRFFQAADGTLRIRFVEPDQVATPPSAVGESSRLGIVTERNDVESVLGYYIDEQFVDVAEIQHRKANVDTNVRRGLSLFYPVRKNLRRAEKLLRNMSSVAEIQSAIALIRKHPAATRAGLEQFVSGQADALARSAGGGKTVPVRRYGPGTILDAHAGIEYQFPASGLDAGNFVSVLQAELRAIASRLVMPEFMLTSDASNANYSSTMVAEGPAMRHFARLQAEQVCDDLEVMWRVVRGAVSAGRLARDVLDTIDIQAVPPSLTVRDQLQEAQRMRIEHSQGILSPQTWAQRAGLDYEQEQANFAAHAKSETPADTGNKSA